MKTRINNYIFAVFTILSFLFINFPRLHAEDAPTYRGKVVLVVDKTIAADPDVSWRIERLMNDLMGDGWRVLRHDVDRGPVHPYDNVNLPGYNLWATQNAPRVREVRALIKADYDAAPTEVKQVLLLGHIPVPYSGTNPGRGVVGGHTEWGGAYPTDFFYGEMTAAYWSGGWSDSGVGTDVPVLYAGTPEAKPYWEFTNSPGDGKFDQNYLPAAPKLAVGRVDLNNMPFFGVNEATLIARYLDKDHDFRCGNFLVQRRALDGTDGTTAYGFCPGVDFSAVVGAANVLHVCSTGPTWFPYVSGATNDFLMGYGAGFGGPFSGIETVGSSLDFAQTDSRIVFVNLFGSFIGLWDEPDDMMRAVLANPYDPANGRFGYGLTAAFETFGVDALGLIPALTNRTLGATIGEAMLSQTDLNTNVGWGLMGDPTLRLHSIQEPSNVTFSKTASQVVLNWSASPDTAVTGYNIYRAPTRRGPYVLVNSSGQVSGTSYTATRPASGAAPDNFYMIRAVKTETTPVGNYTNMSDGLIFNLPGTLTPYLAILNQPANQKIAPPPTGAVANSVVFTVDAVGSDAAGNSQVVYQWYKDGSPISDDCHFKGTTTSSLLISGVQNADAGNYSVVVSNSKLYDGLSELSSINSIASSTVSLTVDDFPTAVNDTYDIVRNTPSDFDVLANDTDPDTANSALNVISVSGLSDLSPGVLTINPDQRTIHFVPTRAWLGPVTFTYVMSDGVTPSQATVTVTVIPKPGNVAPVVSSIGDQEMAEDTTLEIPFTVTDDFTTADNMVYAATCSNPALIPSANFTVTGSGANRILHIKGGLHQFGNGTVTMTVTDEDAGVTILPNFQVTIDTANTPTLVATSSGMQPDGFHFTINGPANSSLEILQSDDLTTWTSLGNVTLGGNIYDFADSTASSSVPHRFYAAINENGCSGNKVGFINIALPAGSSVAIANQLNNPGGNTVDVLFAAFPNGSSIFKWDVAGQILNPNTKLHGSWSQPAMTLNPGEGLLFKSQTAQTVIFVGEVPQGQQINSGLTVTAGNYVTISSIIPKAASLDSLGFPSQAGDGILQWDIPTQQWITTATYNGTVWNPAVPSVQIGEEFLLQSGTSSTRTWTENLPPCMPTVSLTSPANGQTYSAPSSISLSATATADAGIATVEFFQGSTSLGFGTMSGGSYVLTWNNPDSGNYVITAHATDNDGITTISLPANITVQNTLSAEGMSGGNFQFTINGDPGASVEVKASDDLATWTSLGNVTLTGGSYVYSDVSTASFTHRFYRVQENGVCSANTVGFISVSLPANAYVALANQLNNPGGNTVGVLFAAFANGTSIFKWDVAGQILNPNTKLHGSWSQPGMTLNPGEGLLFKSQTAQTVIFVGDVPQGQQINNGLTVTAGNYVTISSIIPKAASLDSLGFPAQAGDGILQWDVPSQTWITTATYNGTVWSPAVPTLQIGEEFLLQSGTSSTRTWSETLSPCP